MLGIDEIMVALWFLPVVLFILVPLTMTCIWIVIYPLIALFRPIAGQSKRQHSIGSAATA